MLLVYYGKGKGKTTAAIGTALRALGWGWKVLVLQFMKGEVSGEYVFINKLSRMLRKQIYVMRLGCEGFVNPEDLSSYAASLNMALSYGFLVHVYPSLTRRLKPKLVVFDELGLAVHMGLIDESLAIRILRNFVSNTERHAIVTGRYVPKTLREIADLVTEVREVRHYFKKGFANIKGLDI
ncbi:MAG: cob(I)yrinic acid a,c-diamide adenosyltransferase [Zestosphaera sp.]